MQTFRYQMVMETGVTCAACNKELAQGSWAFAIVREYAPFYLCYEDALALQATNPQHVSLEGEEQ